MPALVGLVRAISVQATALLVAAGVTVAVLNVTGATNATPIVVTTQTDHGFPDETHVVVAGIVGNTGANGNWAAQVVDATHLALYAIDPATGNLVASAGTGAYVSGGTVSSSFTDGRILIGRKHVLEQSTPPRVVFVPAGSRFGPVSLANRSSVASLGNSTTEQQRQISQPSFATEQATFEVHCWGAANPPEDEYGGDFDVTQEIYQGVLAATHLLAVGVYSIGDLKWADQAKNDPQHARLGSEAVFHLTFNTPLLRTLLPLVPPGTTPKFTTKIVPADGVTGPETGCSN